MDVADLKTFEAVARHGSMNKAASELHTVQSNVTARIRALEEELGLPLFQRHARGVTPTPAGQRMLPFVGRITRLIDEVQAAARDDGAPAGSLVIGGLETTTALRLSPLLTEFARTWPDVRLVVSSGTTARLLQDVVECRLEGAFVAGPIDHPELHQEAVFVEELMLVTSPAVQSLKDLTKIPDLKTIVFQFGCSYRQRLETFLAGKGIVVAKPLEFGSLDAILSCVSAGVGVTLLPKGIVAAVADAGKVAIHRLPKDLARVETLFIRRHDGYVSSALAAFLEMARKVYRAQTPKQKSGDAEAS
ncbi:LysR family transcriptional regulator [Paraburkholderia caballeronis]|uniref:DNA-binding transcriptional regulator, LysR family n=1 Tax=Paraburkholderia caballeronis TaxID=416943 RepID=A0A1H7S4Y5_9BURK|nr:LysR family transcriptional regulator [Paraburkholderia caballeronis]PXW22885.1 DNA-binding transcriptional LysR family regulator [Paraburkholderia caballeronis]PXW97270.1 DNA-binding transcriptional LysR family regulator [Paraburkholderia caballeronis]RAJ93790.1 DNA-binding transcriptional LysR family regulator [Paraburkholderia caballeronis]SED58417.1 DNA-binding transcriptional regulator, LysR family [Paraburkholderia caballeronis]SEL67573.1 DNA-binding transcriptional regulator, LysR fa